MSATMSGGAFDAFVLENAMRIAEEYASKWKVKGPKERSLKLKLKRCFVLFGAVTIMRSLEYACWSEASIAEANFDSRVPYPELDRLEDKITDELHNTQRQLRKLMVARGETDVPPPDIL